ncbi:RIP metalloprotease RseP [bacterium]|nr:RIP metalloprotease RseP [bacterium]
MAEVGSFILYSAIPFIVALGVLIFVHEFGHFIVAKIVGIRVERFSLGFPPRMFGKKVGDTDYCISWIPLGGYVKLSGMVDESMDADSIKGEPWEFNSKPIWQRFLVILAGPVMNVLLAALIIATFVYTSGIGVPKSEPFVTVQEDMPAAEAGIQTGDLILTINAETIETWNDLVTIIRNNPPNTALAIEWDSNGEIKFADVTPRLKEGQKLWLIGVGQSYTSEEVGLLGSIGHGFRVTGQVTAEIMKTLGQLISRKTGLKNSVAGPVSIFSMVGESARKGFSTYLSLIALISLNLGIFNLLPVPVLDGGHLVYLLIEAIIRRPIPIKIKMVIQQIGMALLLILIVLVTINDIMR